MKPHDAGSVDPSTSPRTRERIRRELARRGAPLPAPSAPLETHLRYHEHFVSARCPPAPGPGPAPRLDAARVLPLLSLFPAPEVAALLRRFSAQHAALLRCCGADARRLRAELAHVLAERVARVSDAELAAATGAPLPLQADTRLVWQKRLLLLWLGVDTEAAPGRQFLRPDRRELCPAAEPVRSRSLIVTDDRLQLPAAQRSRHEFGRRMEEGGLSSPACPSVVVQLPPAVHYSVSTVLPPSDMAVDSQTAAAPAAAAVAEAQVQQCIGSGTTDQVCVSALAASTAGSERRAEARVVCRLPPLGVRPDLSTAETQVESRLPAVAEAAVETETWQGSADESGFSELKADVPGTSSPPRLFGSESKESATDLKTVRSSWRRLRIQPTRETDDEEREKETQKEHPTTIKDNPDCKCIKESNSKTKDKNEASTAHPEDVCRCCQQSQSQVTSVLNKSIIDDKNGTEIFRIKADHNESSSSSRQVTITTTTATNTEPLPVSPRAPCPAPHPPPPTIAPDHLIKPPSLELGTSDQTALTELHGRLQEALTFAAPQGRGHGRPRAGGGPRPPGDRDPPPGDSNPCHRRDPSPGEPPPRARGPRGRRGRARVTACEPAKRVRDPQTSTVRDRSPNRCNRLGRSRDSRGRWRRSPGHGNSSISPEVVERGPSPVEPRNTDAQGTAPSVERGVHRPKEEAMIEDDRPVAEQQPAAGGREMEMENEQQTTDTERQTRIGAVPCPCHLVMTSEHQQTERHQQRPILREPRLVIHNESQIKNDPETEQLLERRRQQLAEQMQLVERYRHQLEDERNRQRALLEEWRQMVESNERLLEDREQHDVEHGEVHQPETAGQSTSYEAEHQTQGTQGGYLDPKSYEQKQFATEMMQDDRALLSEAPDQVERPMSVEPSTEPSSTPPPPCAVIPATPDPAPVAPPGPISPPIAGCVHWHDPAVAPEHSHSPAVPTPPPATSTPQGAAVGRVLSVGAGVVEAVWAAARAELAASGPPPVAPWPLCPCCGRRVVSSADARSLMSRREAPVRHERQEPPGVRDTASPWSAVTGSSPGGSIGTITTDSDHSASLVDHAHGTDSTTVSSAARHASAPPPAFVFERWEQPEPCRVLSCALRVTRPESAPSTGTATLPAPAASPGSDEAFRTPEADETNGSASTFASAEDARLTRSSSSSLQVKIGNKTAKI